jgi:anti-sigma factor RsiW
VTTRSGLPDETELHAYADGQLPAERIGAVEGWLAGDAEARARLASWRAQNELILRLYDSPVEPSTAAWLSRRLRQQARRWRQAAAAALVALIAGTGAGWLAHARLVTVPEPMAVLARAATDLEQRSSPGDGPDQLGLPSPELAEQLSQALAHPVLVPDLEAVGLRLVGGRALPIAVGKTAAQLTYADAAGGRFTLYLVRPDAPTMAGFQQVEATSTTGVVWPYEEFHCLLLGNAPRERLVAIAREVQTRLDEGDESNNS